MNLKQKRSWLVGAIKTHIRAGTLFLFCWCTKIYVQVWQHVASNQISLSESDEDDDDDEDELPRLLLLPPSFSSTAEDKNH